MRLIMAKLLFKFDLSRPVSGETAPQWDRWVDTQKVFILWEKGPLCINLQQRK